MYSIIVHCLQSVLGLAICMVVKRWQIIILLFIVSSLCVLGSVLELRFNSVKLSVHTELLPFNLLIFFNIMKPFKFQTLYWHWYSRIIHKRKLVFHTNFMMWNPIKSLITSLQFVWGL